MKTEEQVIATEEQRNRNIVSSQKIDEQIIETVKQVSETVGTCHKNKGTSHKTEAQIRGIEE